MAEYKFKCNICDRIYTEKTYAPNPHPICCNEEAKRVWDSGINVMEGTKKTWRRDR
jgi:hypothetical protein